MIYFHIVMFLALQVIANIFFKWGSISPQHYWAGFVVGNLIGVTSILFMIGMYKSLPVASVVAIGTGGTFVLNQIILSLFYHEKVNTVVVVGILLIFVGILAVSYGGTLKKGTSEQKTQLESTKS